MAVYKKVPGHETVNISTLEFDETPTPGSLNPVTSDGVAKAVDAAKEEMQGKIDEVTLDPSAVALGNVHLLYELTELPADGTFLVDSETNGPGAMPKDTLLTNTAQNALAGNVAPAFDPTRTSENPYKAGESVAYEGKTYTFKVDHYGAWSAGDVYTNNVTNATLQKIANGETFYSILKNALSVRIDNSFNVVSGWKGSVIPVPSGMNRIELDNPADNSYSYRVYFLTSNSLVAGSAAPVVYPIMTEISAGNKRELSIPFGCSYVFVSVYQDVPVNYRFKKDDSIVPVFVIKDVELKADGTIGTQSSQNLFVIETKKLDCPFVRFSKFSDNYFKSAYSTDESVVVGETITLYEGSELGTQFAPFDTNVEVDVPVPPGVNFIILSAYNTASFGVSKSYEKKKVEQFIVSKKVETNSEIQDIKTPSAFGDDIIFRATSTYDASIADIAVVVMSPSGSFASVGYMAYGRFYTEVKSPLASLYRVRFGTGDASDALPIVYRIEVGPLLSYSESKFTFASLNAGCFDHGESTGPTNPPEYGQEFVASWLGFLKEIDADVIMFCEWNIRMTTGDDFFSKRKLLNNFPCVQEYLTGGYTKNAVASRFDTTKYTTVVFDNQYSESSNRNFSFVKINVCGNDVVLVVTHLELTSELRALQIAELIEYFKNEKHVIIGGDFNCANIGEYEPFTKAGYDMANGDMWGVVFTYIGNSVSPAVDYPTDNIVVKGLKMNNPRFPYDEDATDHKAVVADVYLI